MTKKIDFSNKIIKQYFEIALVVLLIIISIRFFPIGLYVISVYCLYRLYFDTFRLSSYWLYLILAPNLYVLFCLYSPENNIALPVYFLSSISFYFTAITISLVMIYHFSYHWKDVLCTQLLFLLPYQFFWRLFTSNSNDHAILHGDGRILWQDFYNFSLMRNGFLPFWNHFSNNGIASFLDNLNMESSFFPVKFMLLFSFYKSNMFQFYQALAFYQVTMISVSLGGMYVFLRMFNLNRCASISGALVFSFNPWIIYYIYISQWIDVYLFSPWVMISILKIIKSPTTKNFLFGVVIFFSLSFLSIAHTYLLAIFILIFIVVYSIVYRERFNLNSVKLLLLAGLTAFLLAGFYTLPTSFNVVQGDIVRSLQPTYDYAVKSYLTFGSFLGRYIDTSIGRKASDDSRLGFGILSLILSFFYLFGIKDKNKPVFLSIFFFFFLLSTAHHFFLRDFIYLYVPKLDQKKLQTGFSFLQIFSVSYFTAAMIHNYSKNKQREYPKIHALVKPLLVVSIIVFLYLILIKYAPPKHERIAFDYSWLFKTTVRRIDIKLFVSLFAMLCLFSLYFLEGKVLKFVLFCLIFFELTSTAKIMAPVYPKDHEYYRDWGGELFIIQFFGKAFKY